MAKLEESAYVFADAYIGSFVKNLMTMQDLSRLASAKDLESAGAVLQEFGYEDQTELQEGNVNGFIRKEQERLTALVYDTIPERKELAFFLFPYDYHNVKVCLKAEFSGMTPDDDSLIPFGDVDKTRITAMVRDRDYMFLSPQMRGALQEAVDVFGRGGDPQEIDFILDKACYKDMTETAKEYGDPFVTGMVKLQIDLMNLKTFTRLRRMNKPWIFFQKVFLEGGNIQEQFFISAYEEAYGQLADKLEPYGLKAVMNEGGRAIAETGSFSLLEKLCDNKLMEYCRNAKYQTFGIAPIAGYWYGRKTELDNLRIILTGLLMRTPAERISERLRDAYV